MGEFCIGVTRKIKIKSESNVGKVSRWCFYAKVKIWQMYIQGVLFIHFFMLAYFFFVIQSLNRALFSTDLKQFYESLIPFLQRQMIA